MYPVKIKYREIGRSAILIPAYIEGFEVVEVGDKHLCQVFYDFKNLKLQMYEWLCGYKTVFDPPPKKEDLVEALQKNIISKEESGVLRQTDWDALYDGMDNEKHTVNWSDDQAGTVFLYDRFIYELEKSRKVVQFKK